MRVLIIGKDASVFGSGEVSGDTRERHLLYARLLRERFGPGAAIRMIAYTPNNPGFRVETVTEGLTLYPTRSLHRVTYLADLIRLLPTVLKNWRPDLITVQTPWEEGTLGFLLSRLLGTRFLPQVHFDLFSDRWRAEHWLNPWRQWVATRLLRGADGVRVVAEGLKRDVMTRLQIAPERVHVVPVGVSFEPLERAEGSEPHKGSLDAGLAGHPVILFVGRLVASKNPRLWLEVAARVLARRPDARFVMAGDGPLRAQIGQWAAEAGIAGSVHLLGEVSYRRLPAIYAAADLFLLTSDHEGFGRVFVEAGLAGLPVVTTQSAGARDLIEQGTTGFAVLRGDAGGLADAVCRLLDDPELRISMGAAGRERMERQFSRTALASRMVECWAAVYRM